MPPRTHMNISPDEIARTMLGRNLLAGRARATVVDEQTGRYISLRASGWRRGDQRMFLPWDEAERVYFNVPNSSRFMPDDPAGFYDIATGDFVEWGRFGAVDPTRGWAARYLLNAAADRDLGYAPGKHLLVGTHCMRCGKELDKRESILAGMGETCAAKAGLPYNSGPGHQLKAAGGRVVWEKPPEDPDEVLREAARKFADGEISIEEFDAARERARTIRADHVEKPADPEPPPPAPAAATTPVAEQWNEPTVARAAPVLAPPRPAIVTEPEPEARVVRQDGAVRAFARPARPVEEPIDISDLPISLRPGEDLDDFIARWDARA